MYPHAELTSLAASKSALRRRIQSRRSECAASAARLARPISWVDRAHARWRRLYPLLTLASVPIGILMGCLRIRPLRTIGAVLRWSPLVLGVVRGLTLPRGASGRG